MSDDLSSIATIVLMGAATVVTRSFFFMSRTSWTLPRWAERGLQYAPVAALAAVIVPEVLLVDGHLIATWRDARLYAALAGVVWYWLRRDMLGTIVVGMAVYLPLHLGLGW